MVSILLLRIKRGISRAKLARHIGISSYRLRRYETAQDLPPPDILRKLAAYFNVDEDYFTSLADNPTLLGHFLSPRRRELLDAYEP